MAKRSGEDRFTAHRGYLDWGYCLSPLEIWHSFRPTSPSSLSQFELWERSFFKSQSSALSGVGLYGSDHSKFSASSTGGPSRINHNESADRRRWQSASCLAPEGAPRFQCQAALEQSKMRRTELIQKLQEAHSHLDTQTDILKVKETQLQQSRSTMQLLELKHKQLTKALSALEEQKKAAEPTHFEESCHWKELQDKVLQLEMDVLKMKSSLESRSSVQTTSSQSNTQLSRTMPVMKDYYIGEGQKNAEKEIKKLKKVLKEAEGKADTLEAEKDLALKQLHFCKEDQQKVLIQVEELKQRLNMSMQVQNELQDQLSETRSHHGQLELEKDLLFTKSQRLEDNIEHQKIILATAVSDKDRLLQEKSELHQKMQSLELQLQRAQLGREGFTQQVCGLHSELTQAKSQASQQQQKTILMKEELRSVKEVNDKLTADLTTATERLNLTLQQLHELQAEKLIHTNQIAALESERLQLISEKEELMDVFDPGNQEELRNLKKKCCQLEELQKTVENERKELAIQCQSLEKKVHNVEADYELNEQQLQCMEKKMEQEKEELKRVAAHWNDRWLDVAMTLQSNQAQLDETKKQQQETGTLRESAAEIAIKVETLKTDLKENQDLIQSLMEEKAHLEIELSRVKKGAGALERVELDACRQQLELEWNRNHTLQQKLMGNLERDGELVQLKGELQKVLYVLKSRDTELEVQQQELQFARSQVTQRSSEVQRLEQLLAQRAQELQEMDLAMNDLMRQRDIVKTEAQTERVVLENELTGLTHLKTCQDTDGNNTKNTQLNATENRSSGDQLKQESDQVLQKSGKQVKEEKKTQIMNRTEKSARSALIDPDQQRRLITEQLKSLFKEREEMHDKVSPVIQRKSGLKSNKLIKGMDMKSSEGKMKQDCKPDLGVRVEADCDPPLK